MNHYCEYCGNTRCTCAADGLAEQTYGIEQTNQDDGICWGCGKQYGICTCEEDEARIEQQNREYQAQFAGVPEEVYRQVRVIGICSWLQERGLMDIPYDDACKILVQFLNDNQEYYYWAAEHTECFEFLAQREAAFYGKTIVIMEDLS